VIGPIWLDVAVGIIVAIILAWVFLIVALAIPRPPAGLPARPSESCLTCFALSAAWPQTRRCPRASALGCGCCR